MNTYLMIIREIKQQLVRYKHKYDGFTNHKPQTTTNQRLSCHGIETEAYDQPECWCVEGRRIRTDIRMHCLVEYDLFLCHDCLIHNLKCSLKATLRSNNANQLLNYSP